MKRELCWKFDLIIWMSFTIIESTPKTFIENSYWNWFLGVILLYRETFRYSHVLVPLNLKLKRKVKLIINEVELGNLWKGIWMSKSIDNSNSKFSRYLDNNHTKKRCIYCITSSLMSNSKQILAVVTNVFVYKRNLTFTNFCFA